MDRNLECVTYVELDYVIKKSIRASKTVRECGQSINGVLDSIQASCAMSMSRIWFLDGEKQTNYIVHFFEKINDGASMGKSVRMLNLFCEKDDYDVLREKNEEL